MFTERDLRRGLKTKTFGHKIFTFQTIDSTNNCAKAVANVGGVEGIVVIAEEQTAGKGRLGRSWLANPEENLTFSLLLRPKVPPDFMNLIPLYAAVGVAQAVERITGLNVECKWPNDLLINKKKVAGILIEGSLQQNVIEYVVIGLGINVNQTSFPDDLLQKATSLKLESNQQIDRTKLFKEILARLEANYHAFVNTGKESILPSWLERTTMINKPIILSQQGNILTGIVKGLSKDGGIVLRTNGSEQTLFAGDVTILGDAPEQLYPVENSTAAALSATHP
jgi:BirA family biotin operon repressor/biotin-[acetyl-CoA-carboxylase] ligase